MKFLLLLVSVFISSSLAQRPSYAGTGPKGRPGLASRFKDTDTVATSTPAVYNRIAEDGTTARIPVDARGDGELVDRLNQWPREHRPFWLLNAEHIESHRNPQANPNPTQTGQELDGQNFIQGNNNLRTRANIDFEPEFNQPETRPIKPNQPRSSFLGPLVRRR